MKTLDIGQATAPLAQYARDAAKETVIVTDGGKPVAALVPIENADMETATLSTDPRFLALIERSRSHHQSAGPITSDEMRRRLGIERPAD